MIPPDTRWIQRFSNFCKAFQQLQDAVILSRTRPLTKLEEQGLIQAFQYTHELAWNTLKDFLEHQGETNLYGSRDTVRLAFRRGLLPDGEVWMDMIKSRNLSSHTYDENTAANIAAAVVQQYFAAFATFNQQMQARIEGSPE